MRIYVVKSKITGDSGIAIARNRKSLKTWLNRHYAEGDVLKKKSGYRSFKVRQAKMEGPSLFFGESAANILIAIPRIKNKYSGNGTTTDFRAGGELGESKIAKRWQDMIDTAKKEGRIASPWPIDKIPVNNEIVPDPRALEILEGPQEHPDLFDQLRLADSGDDNVPN